MVLQSDREPDCENLGVERIEILPGAPATSAGTPAINSSSAARQSYLAKWSSNSIFSVTDATALGRGSWILDKDVVIPEGPPGVFYDAKKI